MKINNSGILRQVQAPLMIFILVLVVLTTFLSTLIVLRLSSQSAMRQASNQAEMAAEKLDDYKAARLLVDYWVDHSADFEPVYDRDAIDDLEREFRHMHPDLASLKDVTEEEFAALSEEDKDSYAHLALGKLTQEFDEIKQVFGPKWLFAFVMKDDDLFFLVTGAKEDELRVSQGGDLFELGTRMKLSESIYPNLRAMLNNSARYSRDEYYSDIDREFGEAGSWIPVMSDGEIIAVIGASKSYKDMFRDWIPAVIAIDILIIVVFAYLEIWIVSLLKKRIINPVSFEKSTILAYMDTKDTVSTVEKLKSIETNNEIESLADSFSQMIEEIERYVENIRQITAESERIGAELNVAAQIQEDMLPNVFPPYPDRTEFDIYASMSPAKEIGGDFYDFFFTDEDQLVLVIGDVSGKGVPAALIMAISKNVVRNLAYAYGSPEEILTSANKALCDGNEESMFVTLWIGIVDVRTGHVVSANAGHEHPAVRRADALYELDIYDHDMPIGIMPDLPPFGKREFDLSPGDSIFVYTDGVPDAVNTEEVFFGTDRMLDVLNTDPGAGCEDVINNMRSGIAEFSSGAERFDDITMLSFTYYGERK